jgi:hypothetical protein
MSESFPAHTVETAPDEVRPALQAMQERMGFIPSMLAKFAEAPPLLMGYQTLAFLRQEHARSYRAAGRLFGCEPPAQLRFLHVGT